ncbi:hypothetical protein N7533_006419 [Penicillium manginii]|jgi:hypothetical protein|uniref:uncharacterized protein n=1 Tax=Penicillium manginii TaxID=203109 RepID=UPI002548AE73|nr:uncharacterized protein N7533_011767 [Penicillium manginii]XP_056956500.1 uncharacterized protein N7533_010633 [Penicillium manginii]XP_056958026.1 uncharacterized protein N7533_006419 [Penicillium manginii]KAJ5738983.1 hypothetical protein N7533_011767 [Penicillium manginii]KAJ5743531.1 hypothetical protein N7533_010633 [Penicillium manginii]KAJ5749391.1 hypothetical protein N7533_006419 [Penicillium manginii]
MDTDQALIPYEASQVLVGTNQFLERRATHEDSQGRIYVRVRLSHLANEALRLSCHTAVQREVWSFPTYEFWIRVINNKIVISANQASRPWCSGLYEADHI